MAHALDDSGISYNEDYNLTHHGASLSEDELERFLHCPVCKEVMGPSVYNRKPLQFSDKADQWMHKECDDGTHQMSVEDKRKRDKSVCNTYIGAIIE